MRPRPPPGTGRPKTNLLRAPTSCSRSRRGHRLATSGEHHGCSALQDACAVCRCTWPCLLPMSWRGVGPLTSPAVPRRTCAAGRQPTKPQHHRGAAFPQANFKAYPTPDHAAPLGGLPAPRIAARCSSRHSGPKPADRAASPSMAAATFDTAAAAPPSPDFFCPPHMNPTHSQKSKKAHSPRFMSLAPLPWGARPRRRAADPSPGRPLAGGPPRPSHPDSPSSSQD